MRVLVTCIPQAGHLTPVLPLAEAFAAQGDQVVVASGPEAAEPVSRRGLSFRQVGPPFGDWFGALVGRTRGTPGDGLPPDRVERYFVPRLFGEIGTAVMVDDLMAAARDLRPDLLVFDALTYAGPLVATALEVPCLQHTVGLLTGAEVLDLVTDAVSPIWREFGLSVPASAGTRSGDTVTIYPAALDPAAGNLDRAQPLRPVPLPHDGPPPADLPGGLWDRPVVYLTLGTFSNGNIPLFRLLLDALAGLPVNVLATVGTDVDPAALGALPPGAHVARFVPQADVLGHCAAAVHHAGAGTALGILAHGLPSVAVPQSADNFAIAGRLAAAGAARVLMPPEVDQDAVRAAALAVLEGEETREAARRLAGDIAGMPSPAEVAALLRSRVAGVGTPAAP
jgi:UDP:flavonoid glycosyltransferase YjiC (YdhE family)